MLLLNTKLNQKNTLRKPRALNVAKVVLFRLNQTRTGIPRQFTTKSGQHKLINFVTMSLSTWVVFNAMMISITVL